MIGQGALECFDGEFSLWRFFRRPTNRTPRVSGQNHGQL
jgi:hypothetical protein